MITLTIQVKQCAGCPRLITGRTYGNDGRDGHLVYKCSEGAFGGIDDWGYSLGLEVAPKEIHPECPHLKEPNESPRLGRVLNQLSEKGFIVSEYDKFSYFIEKNGRKMCVSKLDLQRGKDIIEYLEKSL